MMDEPAGTHTIPSGDGVRTGGLRRKETVFMGFMNDSAVGDYKLKWLLLACAAAIVAFGFAYSAAPSEARIAGSSSSSSAGSSNGPPRNTAPPPPIARNDRAAVAEDEALRIPSRGVLKNDRGSGLRAFKATGPKNGRLTLRRNGSLVYTPKKNFDGRDTFAYRAKDSRGRSDRAVVNITVKPVNDAPVARNNSYRTSEDETLNVSAPGVLKNDTDADGYRLSAKRLSKPKHGRLGFDRDGSFVYVPDKDFDGRDSFTYRARDGKGATDRAEVTVAVGPVNDAPVTKNDSYDTGEDDTLNVSAAGVLKNDTDAERHNLTATKVSGPKNGALTLRSNGSFVYDPDKDFNGSDSFTYRAADGRGGTDTATVAITVSPVNDKPSFTSQGGQTVDEDPSPRPQTVTGWVTSFDPGTANESSRQVADYIITNANGNPVNSPLFTPSGQPDVTNAGNLTYTPADNANGEITLKVRVKDGGGTGRGGVDTSDARDLTITIESVNDAPSFTKGADQSVDEDAGKQTVSGWASAISKGPANESGQSVSFAVTNGNNALFTANGQPAIDPNGTLTYTPAGNANGSATVTVKLKDNGGTANGGVDESAQKTFTIAVTTVNDPPTFDLPQNKNQTVDEDSSGPNDPPNSRLHSVTGFVTNVSPGPTDESGQTVNVVVSEVVTDTEDNDGKALFATGGQPTINSSGDLAYTLAENAFGAATVTVKATDSGSNVSPNENNSEQTFTITVNAVNDAPVVAFDNPPTGADEGDTKTFAFTVTDPDAGDSFAVKSGFPECGTGGTQIGQTATTDAGGSFECRFPDGAANPNVRIQVADSEDVESNVAEQSVNVANVAPNVTVADDQTSNEGENKPFDLGTFTDPGTDGPWEVEINWGDGSTNTTFEVAESERLTNGSFDLGERSHTYADDRATPYEVTVNVAEDGGTPSDSDTFEVAVANVAPTVSITSGDTTADEGDTKTYEFSVTDPGANDAQTIMTSCGTGGEKVTNSDVFSQTTRLGSFECDFPDGPANPTVSVDSNDGDGGTGDDERSVNVANVKPTVALSGPSKVDESTTAERTYTFTVTDPGDDTFEVAANFPTCGANGTLVNGSLAPDAGGGTFKCIFPDGGPANNPTKSNVAIKVTDSDGAADTDDQIVEVTVDNVAPTATFVAPPSADEGSTFDISLTGATDPAGSNDAIEYRFQCGTNAWTAYGTSNTHTCPAIADDPGPVEVKGQVRDEDDGESVEYTDTVDIENVAPNVTAADDQSSDEGEEKSFDLGTFVDPGTDGPWEVEVEWGDGSTNDTFTVGTDTDAFPASSPGDLGNLEHEYADDDTYIVTVTVAEAGGTPSDSDAFEVEVANLPPTADAQSVEIDEDDDGELVTLTGSDPANDPPTIRDALTFRITSLPEDGKLFKGDGTTDEIMDSDLPATLAGSDITYVPDADYFGSDSFDFEVCDDASPESCDGETVSITVRAVNDRPVVDLNGSAAGTGSTAGFLEATGDPATLAPDVEVADVDDENIESATATLTNRPDGDDKESLDADVGVNGITGVTKNYEPSTGTLTISGAATKDEYRQILATVAYDNTASPPGGANRVVEFTVNDGALDSDVATATVTVTPLNVPPVLDLDGTTDGINAAASFTEGGDPLAVAPNATVADADDQELFSVTITLTNRPDGNDESLSAGSSGPITVTPYNPSTGVLTFSGTNLVSQYEALLRTVKYTNTSQNPDTAAREIEVVVNDGQADSVVAKSTVSVTSVNDAPENKGLPTAALSIGEGENLAINGLSVEDVDAGGNDIRTTLREDVGTLALDANVTGGAAITRNNPGSVTLDGTVAEINATLAAGVTYNSPEGGSHTLTMTTNDRGHSPAPAKDDIDTIQIIVDAAPTVTFTTPASTGSPTDVAPNTNITINFSENVAVSNSSFSLKCPASETNSRTFALSATSGNSIALNPDNDLPGVTVCEVRVIAANVTDTDNNDPPNNMAADHTFSFTTAPKAVADDYKDTFTVVGNVSYDSQNSSPVRSVLDNDEKNDSTTATPSTTTSAQGGNVTVRSNGTFTYNPPAGYEGLDTFTYTVNGGSTATVTLRVGGMIWFVNENANTSGDGRFSSPFTSLGAFNTLNNGNANNPAANDNIYLYESNETYTGGVTLLSGQRLIGQDTSQSVTEITSLSRPSGSPDFPTRNITNGVKSIITNASGIGVTLGAGNTIRGLTVQNTSGSGIKGTSVNAATMGGDVAVSGTNGGAAVDISGGNGTVNYAGTISNTAGGAVSVTGRTGGTTTFSGAINSTGGGVNVQNNSGGTTVNFSGTNKTLNTGANDAVTILNNAAGTVNLTGGNLGIDTTSGTGFFAVVGGTVNVSGSNNTINSTGGRAVRMGSVTVGASGVDFDSTTSGGGDSNVELANVGTNGAFDLGTGSLSGASSRTFDVSGGNASVNYSGSVSHANNAPLVDVRNGHTGTLTFNGNLTATNGTGLQFDNADGTYNFNGTTNLSNTIGGADAGIDVTNGSSGTFNIANGTGSASVMNPSGNAVNVSGSSPTFTYGGTINKTNMTNIPIVVQNNTGGAISFTGTTKTLASTNLNEGVKIADNNASTAINFTGGNLTITGTNAAPGFSATGGGTVKVSGAGNTISTVNGTALNVTNTNIGAGASGEGGLNFRSISAGSSGSGPTTSGVVLNNTGTGASNGGLTVTGTGTAGSGGTVQNTGVSGASFTNARNINLNWMNFTNANSVDGGGAGVCDLSTNAGCNGAIKLNNVNGVALDRLNLNGSAEQGVNGINVTNFDLSNSTIQGAGNAINESGIYIFGLFGTQAAGTDNSITNTTVTGSGSANHNVLIRNSTATNAASGAKDRLLVSNSSSINPGSQPSPSDGITVTLRGTANFQTVVQNSTFRQDTLGNGTDGVDVDAGGNSTSDVSITGSSFTGAGWNQSPILISGSDDGRTTFNVSNNPEIKGGVGNGVTVISNGGGSTRGTIANNPNITTAQATNNGSGISIEASGFTTGLSDGTAVVDVDNNTVTNYAIGLRGTTRGEGRSAAADLTIRNNTITAGGNFALFGVYLTAGNGDNQNTTRTCVNLSDNQVSKGTNPDARVDYALEQWNQGTFQIQGLTGSGTTASNVQNFVSSRDIGGASVDAVLTFTVNFTNANCATP